VVEVVDFQEGKPMIHRLSIAIALVMTSAASARQATSPAHVLP
jgi:hypothetical protein